MIFLQPQGLDSVVVHTSVLLDPCEGLLSHQRINTTHIRVDNVRHDTCNAMITVNNLGFKENNPRPFKKISYIAGLTRPILMY